MTTREKYNKLVDVINTYGEKFNKRHGYYVRLNYFNDYCFCMDSWNKSIEIVKNPEYKGIYSGFSGEVVMKSFGIDFGGFELHIPEELLDFYLENLTNFMLEKGIKL